MLRALLMSAIVAAGAWLLLFFAGPPVPTYIPGFEEVMTTARDRPEQVVVVAALILGWFTVFLGAAYSVSALMSSLNDLAQPSPEKFERRAAAAAKKGERAPKDHRSDAPRNRRKKETVDPQRSITLEVDQRAASPRDNSFTRYG